MQRHHRLLTTSHLIRAILIACLFPMLADAQTNDTLTAQEKAQAILARAIASSGGLDGLQTLNESKTTFTRRTASIGQGPTASTVPVLGDPSRTIAYRSGGNVMIEDYSDGSVGYRVVLSDQPDWDWFAGDPNITEIGPLVSAAVVDRARTSGHVLLELVDRSESMRAAGEVSDSGQSYDTVLYADEFGRLQTLFFNRANDRLDKMERLEAHAQWGDLATTISFSDYRKAGNGNVSHTTTIREASNIIAESRVDSIEFSAVDAKLFNKPEGAAENDPFNGPSNASRELSAEMLGENIYFVADAATGYNVVFVNQPDGVVILETPQSPQAARDILRTVGETLPDKKIAFAIPTHHHFDHSGGLYGFLVAGVPILTTSGNSGFVQKVGAARRSIGNSSGPARNVRVETFTGRRTLGNGSTRVDLFDVGPNPHVEEIIVAYIPAIKALLVADIYSFRGNEVVAANANQLAFVEKLEALNLDIDTFIPVHGGMATKAQFWESVKLGREAQAENDD